MSDVEVRRAARVLILNDFEGLPYDELTDIFLRIGEKIAHKLFTNIFHIRVKVSATVDKGEKIKSIGYPPPSNSTGKAETKSPHKFYWDPHRCLWDKNSIF